jgi:hypothetical protein
MKAGRAWVAGDGRANRTNPTAIDMYSVSDVVQRERCHAGDRTDGLQPRRAPRRCLPVEILAWARMLLALAAHMVRRTACRAGQFARDVLVTEDAPPARQSDDIH